LTAVRSELNRPEAAVQALKPIADMTLKGGLEHPNVIPWQADLVEAHIRCESRSAAERELRQLEDRAARTATTSATAAALRCRGLLASSEQFDRLFEQALTIHAQTPLPIEIARTHLCFGERLRRDRRRGEAREQLRHALDTFERTGAELWARRVRGTSCSRPETTARVSR
jgi:hypothetical protein